jgi:hypothetical protein
MQPEHSNIICKGVIGIGTNIIALITSTQEHLEWGLRMFSLSVGIGVGILTACSLIKNLRKK